MIPPRQRLRGAVCLILGFGIAPPVFAQPKNTNPKEAPRLTFATPFVVAAGATTRLKVRGEKLTDLTECRCHEPKGHAALIGKATKVNLPNPALLPTHGDEQVEIDITLPPDLTHREISISVLNTAGESGPLRLLIDDGLPVIAEKEPNNGFVQAQPVPMNSAVEGVIQQSQDVDLFALNVSAGQRLAITAQAVRYGSPAEPYLTLYDDRGRTLQASDDAGRQNDARLDLTITREGRYYLSVVDAHDQGGDQFRYRLTITEGK